MTIPSPICRMGRKRSMRTLIKSKAPAGFTTYIEPFVGSGDIYFFMDLDPSVKAYINDLEPIVANSWKILKTNPSIAGVKNLSHTEAIAIANHAQTTPIKRLISNLTRLCGTFGGKAQPRKDGSWDIIKAVEMENRLSHVPAIAEYMKHTSVSSQDWKAVVRAHDRAGAFIYLDPPYENSKELYHDGVLDYEDMAKVLRAVKGKFLLSINDSANIRSIFKGFTISKVMVKGKGRVDIGVGNRAELLIRNY